MKLKDRVSFEPEERLLACSRYSKPFLCRFHKHGVNGYTHISVQEDDGTLIYAWPTNQLRKVDGQ